MHTLNSKDFNKIGENAERRGCTKYYQEGETVLKVDFELAEGCTPEQAEAFAKMFAFHWQGSRVEKLAS